ncbi:17213_t:CDS:2, partial [Entrophospora sp. SA101]
SITIEDYINCDNTYEIESMPGLEEIIAVGLNKEEEEEASLSLLLRETSFKPSNLSLNSLSSIRATPSSNLIHSDYSVAVMSLSPFPYLQNYYQNFDFHSEMLTIIQTFIDLFFINKAFFVTPLI